VLSVFSASIISDTMAVSNFLGCGIYIGNVQNVTTESRHLSMKHYYEIEVDSGEYARRCYDAKDGADGCNLFSIAYG